MNSTLSRLLRVFPLVVTAIVVTAWSGQVSGSAVVPVAQNVDGSVVEQSPAEPPTDPTGSQQDPTENSDSPGRTFGDPVTIIDPEPPTTEPPTDGPISEPPTDVPTTEPPTDVPTTEPPTDGPSTEPPTDGPTTSHGPNTSAAAPVLAIDHFVTPSGNITCLIYVEATTIARCDLKDTAITEEHDCQGRGVWQRSVTLESGKPAAMRCISDTVMDQGLPVLDYGRSTKVGEVTCSSAEDGVRCQDDSGHGFRLARSSYSVK